MATFHVQWENDDDVTNLIRSKSVSYSREMDSVSIDLCTESMPPEKRTKDTPLTDTELMLASIYVDEAKCGRCGYFGTTPRELRLYKLYNLPILRFFVYFVVCLDLSLALFEEPAVPGLALPYWATMLLEYFCLFVFSLRIFHVWSFSSGVKFWRDKKNLIMVVLIVLTFIDMIMYVIFKEGGIPQHAIRWTRALRPLLLVNISEGRQVRRSFRNIRKTIPEIVNVLVLLTLCIGLFTLLGVKLFGKRNLKDTHGEPYFSNYFDTYFSMYVLTTTANNPDVTMPAYDDDSWSILFFVIFLVICMYIFVSIFLAVVYKNYRKHLKNEVRKFVFERRRQLKEAFDVLKVWHNDKWVVTEQRWQVLMKAVCPKLSAPKVTLLWEVLDEDGDDCIGKKDFLKVAELLNVEVIEVKDRIHFLEQYWPRLYLSYVSVKIRQAVCHRFFIYFFDIVIFANAIFIALDANEYEVIFLVLFNLEICLKLYTFGLREFFAKFWNIFDFMIIGSATLALIIETSYKSLESSQTVLDFLMVLRVLRLVKIIGQIHRFQVIIATVMQIGPAVSTYGAITFVIYYFYAIVGMELFANRIKMFGYPTAGDNTSVWNGTNMFCGTVKLKDTDFFADRYCNNNFNNIVKSMKVLFDLMVVNQWHVITRGFVLVTNRFARIYFLSFHLVCVILVLNIFVAFILEAFMLEYSFSCGKVENAIEKKIEEMAVGVGMSPVTDRSAEGIITAANTNEPHQADEIGVDNPVANGNSVNKRPFSAVQHLSLDHGLRFRLPKQQSKNSETLLQQMFEGELGEDDVGPSDVEDLDELFEQEENMPRANRKLTFMGMDQQLVN